MSDYIPQELLIEILVRLPVRSLLRFRCVSKLWYSLISSSIFISAHTNFINNHHPHHHHNHPDLLLVHHFHDIRGQGYFSLRFDNKSFHEFQEFDVPYNPDFRIVGFCNGLLCSTKETIYNLSSGSSGITVLHNPIIKDTLMLPPPTISPHCHSPPAFGFGFDSKRNDYKVVRIVEDCHNFSPVQVEVFELKTGSWRILADAIVPTVSILFLVGTFFNGGLHWIGENPTRREGNLHQKSILLFDLCREAFQEMKLPNCLASNSTTNLFTGVCQEKLCLVKYNRFMDDQGYQDLWLAKTCSIWVMKEYGVENSWTKLFNIGLREWGIPTAKVLGFRRHGDVVIEADGEVLVYDPKKERPNYLGIVARRGTFYVGDYEESLVFLGGDTGGVQS